MVACLDISQSTLFRRTKLLTIALKAFVANINKRPHELSDQIFKERIFSPGEEVLKRLSQARCLLSSLLRLRLSEVRIIYWRLAKSIIFLFIFDFVFNFKKR